MKITLSIHRLADKVDELEFDRFPIVIGRSPEADITLDDRWVSRRHCEIRAGEDGLVVHDLGSKHGTLVNEMHLSESALKPGDVLSVGLSTLVASYRLDTADAPEVEATLTS